MFTATAKKLIVSLFLLLGIAIGTYIFAWRRPSCRITTVSSMMQIRELLFTDILKQTPKIEEVLVIFDLDNTLIAPVGDVASDQWFDAGLHFYQAKGLTHEQATNCLLPLWMNLFHKATMQAVEPEAVTLISALIERHVLVIAVTSRQMQLSALTMQQLDATHLTFAKSSLAKSTVSFNESSRIRFEQGVLFCSGKDKGFVLAQFLDQLKIHPRIIVCVDDKERHLCSIEKIAEQRNCSFIGLRYNFLDEKVKNYTLDDNSVALLEHNSTQSPFCALPQCA